MRYYIANIQLETASGYYMLRISKIIDYGTLVLTHMGNDPDRIYSASELAQALGLGQPTVSKVLKLLNQSNIVVSTRGATGGYSTARPANEISIAQDWKSVVEGT